MNKNESHEERLPENSETPFLKDDLGLIKNYLTPSFIRKYTDFKDLESFLNSGGFTSVSELEFHAIPEAKLDALVNKNSRFKSWSEMVSSAGDDFFVTQMKAIKFKWLNKNADLYNHV